MKRRALRLLGVWCPCALFLSMLGAQAEQGARPAVTRAAPGAFSPAGRASTLGGPMIRAKAQTGPAAAVQRLSSTSITWSQQSELTAGDGAANGYFGRSVVLSADGTTALVGAFEAAYVFTRPSSTSSTWTQQSKLSDGDTGAGSSEPEDGNPNADDYFGSSLALSANGSTALVGAWGSAAGTDMGGEGAAYVFTRSGDTWSKQSRGKN